MHHIECNKSASELGEGTNLPPRRAPDFYLTGESESIPILFFSEAARMSHCVSTCSLSVGSRSCNRSNRELVKYFSPKYPPPSPSPAPRPPSSPPLAPKLIPSAPSTSIEIVVVEPRFRLPGVLGAIFFALLSSEEAVHRSLARRRSCSENAFASNALKICSIQTHRPPQEKKDKREGRQKRRKKHEVEEKVLRFVIRSTKIEAKHLRRLKRVDNMRLLTVRYEPCV